MTTKIIKEIKSIRFGIYSPDEFRKMSVCVVDNPKLSGPNSVYDERMGASLSSTKPCATCGSTVDICPGHFGHIELAQDVIHPLYYKAVVGFLKCFCEHCYRLVLPKEYLEIHNLNHIKVELRFDMIQKIVDKLDICSHCQHPQPKISLSISDNAIIKSYKKKSVNTINITMTVEDILRIFENIQNSDLELLGFDPAFTHPRNMILSVFPVIPFCSRPFVVTGGGICDDDLTIQLCVKYDTLIPLWNGELKEARLLRINDKIISGDGLITSITRLCFGKGVLFKITQDYGEPYIVNKHHKLTLKYTGCFSFALKYKRNVIYDIPVTEYISMPDWLKRQFKGVKVSSLAYTEKRNINMLSPYSLGYSYGNIENDIFICTEILTSPLDFRISVLKGILDALFVTRTKDGIYCFDTVFMRKAESIVRLARGLGWYATMDKTCVTLSDTRTTDSVISVELLDSEDYFVGFTVDDPKHQFLLSDMTITHNCEIIKINNQLKASPNDIRNQKMIQTLKFKIHTFFDNSKSKSKHTSSGRPIKGIKERLTSKDGLLRNNLLGKRTNFSARTVIGPEPSLKIDELGMPNEVADTLTFPEIVNKHNIDKLTEIVNNGKAVSVINNEGRSINIKYALFRRGTELLYGDEVYKLDGKRIKINDKNYNYQLSNGDRIMRNGVFLSQIKYPQKKSLKLEIGFIVNRCLVNGDPVCFGRQPTLHKGSMMTMKIVRMPGKTFRFNLSVCKSFNSDFDGDEMNVHVPASYEAASELLELASPRENIITPQTSKPNITIVQDTLLAAYKMTRGEVSIRRDQFYQCVSFMSSGFVLRKLKHIESTVKSLKLKYKVFSGRGLISLILPSDFYYEVKNNAWDEEPVVKIHKGVMISGTLSKEILGASYNSLITILHKEYGVKTVCDFVDNIQFIAMNWLLIKGFSVGLGDCLATQKEQIENVVERCFIEAKGIEETTRNPYIRELKITACLGKAKDIGMKLAKEALKPDNSFISTVMSGSKGDYFNIAQITGIVGQQNLGGKRIPNMLGERSLPHYPMNETLSVEQEYEARGFIRHSFIHGLNPKEFYFHAMTGREGITDTAMGTAKSGYIQIKIIKLIEDIQVNYDNTVRNTTGTLFQSMYGDDGLDASMLVKTKHGMSFTNIERLSERLNNEYESTVRCKSKK